MRVAIFTAACSLGAVTAVAQQRFPRPEFDGGYELPPTGAPPPEASWWGTVDVGVLLVALLLAAFFALWRPSRQGLAWLSVASLLYFGFLREGCVCAVGSLQNVAAALADPHRALPLSVLAFFVLPLLAALFVGRVFCAGVCPLGALQDRLILKPLRVPANLDRSLALLRHLVLGVALLFAACGSFFLLCRFDPLVPVFRLSGGAGILACGGALLLLGTVVARPYCRWLCPYAVLLGWMARFASHRLHACGGVCVDCNLCAPACPLGAIEPPNIDALPEDRRVALGRLRRLVLALPVVVLLSAWAVSQTAGLLALSHPRVQLLERLAAEAAGEHEESSLESRSFRISGASAEELQLEVDEIRERFRVGSWLLGAYLGLVVMLSLIQLARWRRRERAEPDPGSCVSCGRCFASCPQDQVAPIAMEDVA